MNKQKMDTLTFSVLANKLESVTTEVINVMLRSAHSTTLNMARDFSASICDWKCRLVSIAEGIPIHVMTSNMALKPIPDLFNDIAPGDMFLNNSPYYGNSHHADWTFCTPVFSQGKLMFWMLLRVHQVDTGAPIPTVYLPFSKETYEEGLHFPCVRIQRDYKTIEDFVRMGQQRIRVPEQWYADFLAAIGSSRIGDRRLVELCEKCGNEVMEHFIEEWIGYGDRRMAAEIRSLPRGTWEGETWVDPLPFAPDGIQLKMKLTTDPEEGIMTVDLTECPDQVEGGINLTEANAMGGVMQGLFWCLDPTLPHNSGAFERVKVVLREGCIAGIPRFPVGTSVATSFVAERLANMAMAVMARVDPQRGTAEGGLADYAGAVLSGKEYRRNATPYVEELIFGSGAGPGVYGCDGWINWFTPSCQGEQYIESMEVHELYYPHIFEANEVIIDTLGAGKWNGAPGRHFIIAPRGHPLTVAGFFDGKVHPPQGVLGGGPACPNRAFVINRKTRDRLRELPLCGLNVINKGEALEAVGGAGAGYGDPLERDPEMVRWDVRKDWVSPEMAREVYGVVLDLTPEQFAVDYEATRKLREEKKKARR